MKDFYTRYKTTCDRVFLILGILLFLAVFALVFRFIAPFVVAFIISLILSPLVDLIQKKWRIPRGITSLVLIVALLTGVIFLGGLLVSRIISEVTALAQGVPTYIENVQTAFQNLLDWIEGHLGEGVYLDPSVILNQLLVFATGLLQSFINGGNFLTAIPVTVLRIIITIIAAFFFIKDKQKIYAGAARIFPSKVVERVRSVRQGMFRSFVGYVKGQLIMMLVVAAVQITGLTILGAPYPVFVGIGIALVDILPVLGPGTILVPWAIYSFVSDNVGFGIGLLVLYAACFILRQVLEPRIVGKQVGLHPLLFLMSIYIGFMLIGPVGVLIGPVTALLIKAVVQANSGELEVRDKRKKKKRKKRSDV